MVSGKLHKQINGPTRVISGNLQYILNFMHEVEFATVCYWSLYTRIVQVYITGNGAVSKKID